MQHATTDRPLLPRATAAGAIAVPAILVAAFALGSGPSGASKVATGVTAPRAAHFEQVVRSLQSHPGRHIGAITVSGREGRVRVTPSGGAGGFPAAYLNPLGISVVESAVAAKASGVRLTVMRLAPGAGGRLHWTLTGIRDGHRWSARLAPNGTGLQTTRG